MKLETIQKVRSLIPSEGVYEVPEEEFMSLSYPLELEDNSTTPMNRHVLSAYSFDHFNQIL